ncbi:hypothetical protein ABPG77_003836 [Micractinium sp. CCAP 211/92]
MTVRVVKPSAAVLVLAAALAGVCSPAAAEKHNVLEHFPAASSVRVALASAGSQGIHIHYNTSKLHGSGQWIEVSWSGVPSPDPSDLLAVYSPPNAYADGRAPIKFANASDAPGHLASGGGSLTLRLVNMRADVRVVLVRGGPDQPTVAARGPVIRNRNPNEPSGIHLMRTRSPSEMLVQFTTRDAAHPVAQYGRAQGALEFVVPARTATYGAADMCGGPASGEGFLDPGLLHTALLTGLEPGQLYWYRVGDARSGLFSDEYSFRAAPAPGPDQTVHILTLADQGVGEVDGSYAAMEYRPAADVAAHTIADGLSPAPDGRPYSLVLHNGDISYARGYAALWDAWLYQQQELAARVPYMVCQGNHERDWLGDPSIPYRTIDSGGECGVPYEHRFPMPSAGRDQPWYSFEHGPVHFTVMSTEHFFGPGSQQHLWLEADLAAVNRSRTPWLVLVGHRPIYIDADEYGDQGKQTTALQLQMALEHLLGKHGVDVALSGHHHSYQRTCPVLAQRCRPHTGLGGGVVHLCVGHAGAQWYDNGFVARPDWVAYENQVIHGHARLHINATHFHMEAIDSGGQLFDEVVLTKNPAPTTAAAAVLSRQVERAPLLASLRAGAVALRTEA